LTVTLAGDVKPVPEVVKRILNGDAQHGERVTGFNVWPTARPGISIDRGERIKFSIRIRPSEAEAAELQLSTKPTEKIDYKLRREAKGSGYWLDVEAGPFSESGSHQAKIEMTAGANPATAVTIYLSVYVLSENLIATPNSLDLGELHLPQLTERARLVGRLGLRKTAGTFRITTYSASLPFIKLERQIIVDGSNYLIRLTTDPASLPKPGSYTGVLRMETDDREKPIVEIPIKVTVVDR
jgi:hypothetical protein